MKIAVVGAGLSGLAAAIRLRDAGHEVLVIEAGDKPGGRCKTFARDGYLIDCCPEIAATSYVRWLELVRRVGLAADIVQPRMIIGMLKDGRQLDIDLDSPLTLPFTPLLSWGAKLRVLRAMLSVMPKVWSLPDNLMDAIALDDPNIRTDQLALKLFGEEATKYLVDPVVRLSGTTRMDLVSVLTLYSGLSDFSKLITLRGGLDRVPKAVAAQLDMRYGTRVERVHSNRDGVTLDVTDASGAKHGIAADKCLVTAQYHDAARMYPRLAELAAGYADSYQYMRMIDLKLAYAKATRSKAWGVLAPFCEDPEINFLALTHNKCPDRAPPGHSLMCIYTEDVEYERQAALSDEQLVAWGRSRVEALHPELRSQFLFSYVSRQPRTCALPTPGHFRRAKRYWEAIGTEPRVQLGGDMFIYGSMECAVAVGERAADRLVGGGERRGG